MAQSPFQKISKHFESKEKLIKAVRSLATSDLWTDRLSKKKGLDFVSNAKLERLHRILTKVKTEFGSRAKLIEEILKAENRDKDSNYKSRFEAWSTPKLLDYFQAVSKRIRNKTRPRRPKKPKTEARAAKAKAPSKRAATSSKASKSKTSRGRATRKTK